MDKTVVVIGAKVPKRIHSLLKEVCEKRVEDVSDFIRQEICTELARLSYLSRREKKALALTSGVKSESHYQG